MSQEQQQNAPTTSTATIEGRIADALDHAIGRETLLALPVHYALENPDALTHEVVECFQQNREETKKIILDAGVVTEDELTVAEGIIDAWQPKTKHVEALTRKSIPGATAQR